MNINEDKYYIKYLKYKNLYLELNKSLKYQFGGNYEDDIINEIFGHINLMRYFNKLFNNMNTYNYSKDSQKRFVKILKYLIYGDYSNNYSYTDLILGIKQILNYLIGNNNQIEPFLKYLNIHNYNKNFNPTYDSFYEQITNNFIWKNAGGKINYLYYIDGINPSGILSELVNLKFIDLLIQKPVDDLKDLFQELKEFFDAFNDRELLIFYEMLHVLFYRMLHNKSIDEYIRLLDKNQDNFIIKFIEKNKSKLPKSKQNADLEKQNIEITEMVLQHIIDQLSKSK